MTESISNIFNAKESSKTTHKLEGTTQLTEAATDVVSVVLDVINANPDTYVPMVRESQTSYTALDNLIRDTFDITTIDVSFINALSDDTIASMLKSQQSRKSRCKSATMTMENYKNLLVATVSEMLLRIAIGKPRASSGNRRATGDVSFSQEELEALAKDQRKLRAELRNVQSKKSIAKKREGFSESDEYWQALLKAEKELKDIRSEDYVNVNKTQLAIQEMLGTVDIGTLKAAKAKELLKQIYELSGVHEDHIDEEHTDEEHTDEKPIDEATTEGEDANENN